MFSLFDLSLNAIYLFLQKDKYHCKKNNNVILPVSLKEKIIEYENNKTIWKTFYVDVIDNNGYNILSSVMPFNLPETLICNVCKRFPIEFVIYKKNYYTQLVCELCIVKYNYYYLLTEINNNKKQYEQNTPTLYTYIVYINYVICDNYTRNMKVVVDARYSRNVKSISCFYNNEWPLTVTFGELFDIKEDVDANDESLCISIKYI